jgi:hypothetical protein
MGRVCQKIIINNKSILKMLKYEAIRNKDVKCAFWVRVYNKIEFNKIV